MDNAGGTSPSRPRLPEPVNAAESWIRRKQVLSGLTHKYCIAARLPAEQAKSQVRVP